jgi:nucleotide-binding universal stress UspA family protein
MKRMLIAIDDSEGSWKAVDYVGQQFAGAKDLAVTLLHVAVRLPPQFWDDGHLLSEQEKQDREKVVDTWLSNQKKAFEPLFKRAVERLVRWGIGSGQIATKVISDSIDPVFQSILGEARAGEYQTLVIGRFGHRVKRLLLGSTANRVINAGAGMAICVVE